MFQRGRLDDFRYGLGALSGAVPGRDHLPAQRLPHRRAEAGREEANSRQDVLRPQRCPRLAETLREGLPPEAESEVTHYRRAITTFGPLGFGLRSVFEAM